MNATMTCATRFDRDRLDMDRAMRQALACCGLGTAPFSIGLIARPRSDRIALIRGFRCAPPLG